MKSVVNILARGINIVDVEFSLYAAALVLKNLLGLLESFVTDVEL